MSLTRIVYRKLTEIVASFIFDCFHTMNNSFIPRLCTIVRGKHTAERALLIDQASANAKIVQQIGKQ